MEEREPLGRDEACELLTTGAAKVGVDLEWGLAQSLLDYLEMMLERNKVVNLTAVRDYRDGIFLHLIDSLAFLPRVEQTPGSLLDIGTGAGLPGIPLALATGRHATLVDSVGKKVAACADFARALGIDRYVRAEHVRIEDYARTHGGSCGVVVARAVAPLETLVEYGAPLLCGHGRLVFSKGNLEEDELDASLVAADVCGLKLVSHESLELPGEYGHREFCVYEKVRKSRVTLPRKVGEARRNPLSVRYGK